MLAAALLATRTEMCSMVTSAELLCTNTRQRLKGERLTVVFLACSELVRYRQFLGIQKEQQNIKEEQEKLKNSFAAGKDIVSPDNLNTINQTKAEGTPADRYLSGSVLLSCMSSCRTVLLELVTVCCMDVTSQSPMWCQHIVAIPLCRLSVTLSMFISGD